MPYFCVIIDAVVKPMRLLGLQSRQSAAYKGVMALILKNHARDFISGAEMDFSTFSDEKIDIHHIFPKDYCIKKGSVSSDELDGYVESHWINHNLLRADDFQSFLIGRAKKLLTAIETATGRTISGKDSDEVQQAFGAALN